MFKNCKKETVDYDFFETILKSSLKKEALFHKIINNQDILIVNQQKQINELQQQLQKYEQLNITADNEISNQNKDQIIHNI